MNKDVWKMVAYAREHLPDSKIALTTNGNFPFNEDSVLSGLSLLHVSVDGYLQESYETYRKNGNVKQALNFKERPDPAVPAHVTNAGWIAGYDHDGWPLTAGESYQYYIGSSQSRTKNILYKSICW